MARQFLQGRDVLAGSVRRFDSVHDLKERYADRLWVAVLDLTDGPAIKPVVDWAFAELGTIDVIVNNEGYGLFGAAESLTDEQVRHQIDTNLVGPIQVTRAAIPYLRAQGGGHILAISTYGGQAHSSGCVPLSCQQMGHGGFV
jgi:NAD(P)-dependent dehydrogenase (short-subunit alcohol dehydrogenase family)